MIASGNFEKVSALEKNRIYQVEPLIMFENRYNGLYQQKVFFCLMIQKLKLLNHTLYIFYPKSS
jgi:hypothetical protein